MAWRGGQEPQASSRVGVGPPDLQLAGMPPRDRVGQGAPIPEVPPTSIYPKGATAGEVLGKTKGGGS